MRDSIALKASPAALADRAISSLQRMTAGHVRRDYREAANSAINAIHALLGDRAHKERRNGYIAREIANRAASVPLMVYRTKKTGAIRWQRADTPSAARIPFEQVVGYFDANSDWRDIEKELNA